MTTEQKIVYEKLKNLEARENGKDEALLDKLDEVDRLVGETQDNVGFDFYKPIASERRVVGRAITSYKKFIRKSIASMIVPMLEEQTLKNKRFSLLMEEMAEAVKMLRENSNEMNEELRNKIDRLEHTIEQERALKEPAGGGIADEHRD
ncbi:MAG: hypothetical protein ACOYJB_04585 [Christensenellaceae bacterium]